VAGVVAASVADDNVRRLGEHINDFAFAFVAPLGADQNCIRHNYLSNRHFADCEPVMIDDRHHGPHYSQPADFSAAPDVHNKNPRMKIRGKGAGLCVKKLGRQRANVNSRPGEK
jgi:hypothetical protein